MEETAPTTPPNESNNARKILIGAGIFIVVILIVIFVGRGSSNKTDVLATPSPGDESTYNAQIASMAQVLGILVIGKNCTMSPLVLQLPDNGQLTIQNNDSVMHTITFEIGGFFTVSANDSRVIDFGNQYPLAEGIYRYRCNDLSKDNVGVLYVQE